MHVIMPGQGPDEDIRMHTPYAWNTPLQTYPWQQPRICWLWDKYYSYSTYSLCYCKWIVGKKSDCCVDGDGSSSPLARHIDASTAGR